MQRSSLHSFASFLFSCRLSSTSSSPRLLPKRIRYGSAWSYLRQSNAFVADKTAFIRRLEEAGRYLAIARPSCFGKTLLCDQIAVYYDSLTPATLREQSFKNTNIERNGYTASMGQYLLLRFNFSAISTDGDFRSNFQDYVNGQIKNFVDRYSVYNSILKIPVELNKSNHLDSFQQLLHAVHQSNEKVYVIIDDYDFFINRSLFDCNRMSASVGDALSKEYKEVLTPIESILRSFGNLLKIGSTGPIERILLTGTVPLSACLTDSSSFSMIKDITSDPKFDDMLGFDEGEINDAINTVLYPNLTPRTDVIEESNLKPSSTFVKLHKYMRSHFAGYRFHKDQKHELFHPQLCIYFLDQLNNKYFSNSDHSISSDENEVSTSFASSSVGATSIATSATKLAISSESETAIKDRAIRIKYDENIIGSNVITANIAQMLMSNYNNNNSNLLAKGHYSWAERVFSNKAATESVFKRAFFHGFLTYSKPILNSNNSVTLNKQGIFINSDINWFGKQLVIPNFAMKRLYLDNMTKQLPADIIDNMYTISTEKNLNKKKTLIQEFTQSVKSKLLDPEVQSAVLLTLERLF